jgi:hypothetical protein
MAIEWWKGWMDWPLDKDWECVVCGRRQLMWGFIHAQCRCDACHTQYRMRDLETDEVVATPICMLKPELRDIIIELYQIERIPIDEMDIERILKYAETAIGA